MAYILAATGACRSCGKPATKEIINRFHGSEGRFCDACGSRAMDHEMTCELVDLPTAGRSNT